MRRFELSEGTSNKFWEIEQQTNDVVVRFGRIGTQGQTQTKTFGSEALAKAELDKLVREKVKKGYGEKTVEADVAKPKDAPVTPSSTAPDAGEGEAAEPKKKESATAAPAKPAAAKGAPTKIESAKAAPQKAAPQKAAPQKAAPQKAEPQKTAPQKTEPQKTEPQKTEPEKKAGPSTASSGDGFIETDGGYALGVRDGKLAARNAKGQMLASVPKGAKESALGEQLTAMLAWLDAHRREALESVDLWMLRSLPVPTRVVRAAWQDDAYRAALENLVVFATTPTGELDKKRGGLLKGADPKRGVGVVDRDGESAWIDASELLIPHPILIDALDDWRALTVELGVKQLAPQIFREVFTRPDDVSGEARAIERFSGGTFKQLAHAIGAAKTLGYRVSGGSTITRVMERGRTLEARYWIGDEDPMSEGYTGSLLWVDDKQVEVRVADVTPIALSEGMRMASAVFAKRVIEEKKEEA